jgi:hypothetical protein
MSAAVGETITLLGDSLFRRLMLTSARAPAKKNIDKDVSNMKRSEGDKRTSGFLVMI